MALAHTLSDPTDLDGLRRFLKAGDKDSRLLPLEMLRVDISSGAHLKLADAATEALVGKVGPASIVLFTDTSSIMRGDQKLSALVQSQLQHHNVKPVVLDGGHATLHAD